ncbi:Probable fructokinase-4 [Geodia barretti]|uniref:fructokinase n=1 Tax=Geodia barretti TaxID=519541 RepID=A0AA35TWI6_GEOBA|nr:Probable fructokinase-4 [Geodia barretti]
MPKALCIGELLIDFVSTTPDVTLAEAPGFVKAPGGAPANVAVGLAKLGMDAGFIGKVGADAFGDFLRETLQQNGVDTDYLIAGEGSRTTLAFVATRSDGMKDITFYRHPGADIQLSRDEINTDYVQSAELFHYGSVSLSHSPSREATLHAIQSAKAVGAMLSYDPNLRLMLWDNAKDAKHVVKISEEEWEFVTGDAGLEQGIDRILGLGVKLLVVTLGERGCYYTNGITDGFVDGFIVDVVDTLGAGDAFVAAMLIQLIQHVDLLSLKKVQLDAIMRYANAAGALATQKVGVIPALPTHSEIESFL